MPQLRCGATNADGTRCRSPSHLVNEKTGLCRSHDPEKREAILEAARKGGEATARKFKSTGLDADELPPLTNPEAAELWLERIGRAVATGRLGHNEGRSVTSAVREWLKAHEVGKLAEQLESLREQIEAVKAERHP